MKGLFQCVRFASSAATAAVAADAASCSPRFIYPYSCDLYTTSFPSTHQCPSCSSQPRPCRATTATLTRNGGKIGDDFSHLFSISRHTLSSKSPYFPAHTSPFPSLFLLYLGLSISTIILSLPLSLLLPPAKSGLGLENALVRLTKGKPRMIFCKLFVPFFIEGRRRNSSHACF